MTRHRVSVNLLSAALGALVGGAAVLSLGGTGGAEPPSRPRPAVLADPTTPAPGRDGRTLLAWAPGGLPANAERTVERLRGVRDATTVVAGLDWITSATDAAGSDVDAPPRGFAIPFETALVEPREYARFVAPRDRPLVEGLGENEMVLARTEESLRGAGEGLVLHFQTRSAAVEGVVADQTTNGYEGLARGPVPSSWGHADAYLLVHLRRAAARQGVEDALSNLLAPGQVLRVRAQGETPFLRYGDAVLPQMLIKKEMGEFAARPSSAGTIEIDPRWVRRNIQTARVPILGEVRCHRWLFPQLRAALREVVADGLEYAVDPGDYGGCYSPRFVDSNPAGRLSHHSWGIAIDLNVAENAFGSKPDQDQRLVRIMEDHGFTWGGRWLVPDGMHFEWVSWP